MMTLAAAALVLASSMPKAFAGAASNGMVRKWASPRYNVTPRFSRMRPKRAAMQQTARNLRNSRHFAGSSRTTGNPVGFGSNLYIRSA
jgi:hypothetical protein